MNLDSKVIPAQLHPMGFIDGFTHFGADLDALLANTGINKNTLQNPTALVSYRQQHQLVVNGIALCNRPGIGLLIGSYVDWSFHGSVGNVVYCAPSLQDAGYAFRRYLTIAEPYFSMYVNKPLSYVNDDGWLINPLVFLLDIGKSPEEKLFEIEYRIANSLRVWDMCGNKSVKDSSVHLHLDFAPPAHAEMYDQLPCASVSFNADQSYITSPIDFAIAPHRQFHRHVFQQLMLQCEAELNKAEVKTSFAAKVKWHLLTRLHLPALCLEDLTPVLALSPRAIRRKLAEEGASFRQIYSEVKMETSAYYLRCSTMSFEEIADLMGFANASSFRRAMRNWQAGNQQIT